MFSLSSAVATKPTTSGSNGLIARDLLQELLAPEIQNQKPVEEFINRVNTTLDELPDKSPRERIQSITGLMHDYAEQRKSGIDLPPLPIEIKYAVELRNFSGVCHLSDGTLVHPDRADFFVALKSPAVLDPSTKIIAITRKDGGELMLFASDQKLTADAEFGDSNDGSVFSCDKSILSAKAGTIFTFPNSQQTERKAA